MIFIEIILTQPHPTFLQKVAPLLDAGEGK